ncbi:MAG: hypothetical protein QMD10_10760, partial [Desulfitobacteriaceae bacterium]|nr:hypothetical protein [Desulfitobacteriaceae bacterium]
TLSSPKSRCSALAERVHFTADQHFGHANIIKHCNRPFGTVTEMDEYLLEQWNSCVDENDTIYILGDLFFRNVVSADAYLNRLHGKKHLIILATQVNAECFECRR